MEFTMMLECNSDKHGTRPAQTAANTFNTRVRDQYWIVKNLKYFDTCIIIYLFEEES